MEVVPWPSLVLAWDVRDDGRHLFSRSRLHSISTTRTRARRSVKSGRCAFRQEGEYGLLKSQDKSFLVQARPLVDPAMLYVDLPFVIFLFLPIFLCQ